MKKFYLKLLLILSIVFFFNNCLLAQSYEVKGAGTEDVNGIYVPTGKARGKTKYVKGDYVLFYKGCHSKWMIKSSDGNFYRNKKDSNTPPENGWEKGCGKGSMDPAPTVIPSAKKTKLEKTNTK
jgi:hypothetical protein